MAVLEMLKTPVEFVASLLEAKGKGKGKKGGARWVTLKGGRRVFLTSKGKSKMVSSKGTGSTSLKKEPSKGKKGLKAVVGNNIKMSSSATSAIKSLSGNKIKRTGAVSLLYKSLKDTVSAAGAGVQVIKGDRGFMGEVKLKARGMKPKLDSKQVKDLIGTRNSIIKSLKEAGYKGAGKPGGEALMNHKSGHTVLVEKIERSKHWRGGGRQSFTFSVLPMHKADTEWRGETS